MKRFFILSVLLSVASIQALSMFAFSSHMSGGMDMPGGCPLPIMMKGQCAPTNNPLWALDHHVEMINESLTTTPAISALVNFSIFLSAVTFLVFGLLAGFGILDKTFFWKKHEYWRQIAHISKYRFMIWFSRKFRKIEMLAAPRVYTYS